MSDFAAKLGDGHPSPVIHVPKNVVTPQTHNARVFREGLLVGLTIGNATVRMPYKTAMTVGQWLMAKGAEAKFLDGDTQRLIVDPPH